MVSIFFKLNALWKASAWGSKYPEVVDFNDVCLYSIDLTFEMI